MGTKNNSLATNFILRLLRLILGLFLYALGIVVTLKAHVGYAPWDVLHVGLASTIGVSIGLASILVGVIIIFATVLLGEKLGLGTILNMLLIGVFLDMILNLDFIPTMGNTISGIAALMVGLFVISIATYFYIGSGFGAGPRDSLMVALARKTRLPIGLCRGAIEISAVLIGWKLGGMVGIGTVISALAVGFCIQITFGILKFDPKSIKHESLTDTWRHFTDAASTRETNEQ